MSPQFCEGVRYGGGYPIVVEPRVLVREYGAKSLKARINLGELASLRREGWKTRDLAKRYGVSLSAVKTAIWRRRDKTPEML